MPVSSPIELRWLRVPLEHETPGFAIPSTDEGPVTKVVLEFRCLLPRPHGITLTPHEDSYGPWTAVLEAADEYPV
jgi:hypothetical protein